MSQLAEFLLARIAKDEAGARRFQHAGGVTYRSAIWEGDPPIWENGHARTTDLEDAIARGWVIELEPSARVLAECDAKRRIVEWHERRDDCCEERYGALVLDADPELSAGTDALGDLTIRQSIGRERYIGCVTLMLLALPFADHPDYREEWRP